MPFKLNQAIAVKKNETARRTAELTKVYQLVQGAGAAGLAGVSRVYTPKDELGEQLPSESKRVQFTVEELLAGISEGEGVIWNVASDVEIGNTVAKADIVVDGVVLAKDVPATVLLFLEKHLVDQHTVIAKMPELSPEENWSFDGNKNFYTADPVETTRTKKILRNHVKAEATEKHPAQVDTFSEDVVIGTWKTTKFSGALPTKRKRAILSRIVQLQNAVKIAREEANSVEVTKRDIAKGLFEFILGSREGDE